MCLFALILGMLIANMLKDVCGCNILEGQNPIGTSITRRQRQKKAQLFLQHGRGGTAKGNFDN